MEFAPAKINLTLHVTGLRADGYHLLDSLVVFADVGDFIWAEESDRFSLNIEGPEAAGLTTEKDNLVLRAARMMDPARRAALKLQKNLPTASGIGGGSADAAATLRLLARVWSMPVPKTQDALPLGADVPVCLVSKPTRMQGIGETLSSVPQLPDLALLLVNPRKNLHTPLVFKAMKNKENKPMDPVPEGANLAAFSEWLARQRNDLETAAVTLEPVISEVLRAVSQTGAMVTRMSGSGATCFGIFPDFAAAQKAAKNLLKNHPDWWIKPAQILG